MNNKEYSVMEKQLDKFRQLREEIEANCTSLHSKHKEHTLCREGCSECCMNFRILPIEFHTLVDDLKDRLISIATEDENGQCIFLQNERCSIYDLRPTICRSHGLPILELDDETEEYLLSFCPLNFKSVDDDYFTLETSFRQDLINQKAYELNIEFLQQNQELGYANHTLLPLNDLRRFIQK